MICPMCGVDNTSEAKFCGSCGAALTDQASEPAQPAVEPQTPEQPAADAGVPQQPAAQPYAPYESAAQQPQQPAGQSAPIPPAGGYYQAPAAPVPPAPAGQTPYGNASQYAAPADAPLYPMTESDRTLRLVNFILCVVSTVVCGIAIIPLAWMIPMTVISWGIYKGKKRNTVAFGICTLIFVNMVGGILLLVSHKDE